MVHILYQQSAVQMEVPLKNSEIRAARICFGWPRMFSKQPGFFFFCWPGKIFLARPNFFAPVQPAWPARPGRPPAAAGRNRSCSASARSACDPIAPAYSQCAGRRALAGDNAMSITAKPSSRHAHMHSRQPGLAPSTRQRRQAVQRQWHSTRQPGCTTVQDGGAHTCGLQWL